MSNLLDKASIVLTPTAYNNGEALCVKPSDGSGDFDFSRNSAATRVNAQGLVENVQILSSNLVQNGDFSEEGAEEVSNGSFSQEGAELVTNGSFDTDSDWVKGAGWSISGGKASCDGVSSNSNLATTSAFYSGSIPVKMTINVTDYVSGGLKIYLSSTNFTEITANGDYTFYTTADRTDGKLYLKSVNFNGSIDNVSVKEVGQDWDLDTSWSIGVNSAIYDGLNSSNDLQQTNVLNGVIGTSYAISFEVTSGTLRLLFGEGAIGLVSYANYGVGVHTVYGKTTTSATGFRIYATNTDGGTSGSITNISVKEVGQNWNFGGDWELVNGTAEIQSATTSYLSQVNVVDLSVKNYRLQYEVVTTNGSNFRITGGSSAFGTVILDSATIGVKTIDLTSNGTQHRLIFTQSAFRGSIDNISLIEITDDTNLPRINYEGFSYQDALGSELLTTGVISNNGGGSFTFITDGLSAVSDGTSGSTLRPRILWSALTVGNQYQITGTPTINSGTTNYSFYDGISYIKNQVAAEAFDITFTCGGSNVFFTNDGNQTFNIDWDLSIKELLGQEVVPDSGCGSWLFEPQSTNLIEYSNDYTDAYWIKATSGSGIAPVVTSNYAISPDGTQNADRIQFDATTSGSNADRSRIRTTLSLTDTSYYTFSFYAKSTDGTDQNIGVLFDNSQISTFTITDEWQRFEATQQQFGTSSICGLDLRSGNAFTSDILVYGIQVEQQTYATSYIPTEGSTVTRNQDVCTNGGSLASINSTEGVLYAEIAALANDSSVRGITINDNSNQNRILIRYSNLSNNISAFMIIGNVLQAVFSQTISDIKEFSKIAVRYSSSNFALYINGVKINQDNSVSVPLADTFTRLDFNTSVGGSPFFGKTKALAVWKEALSDEELTELTTI